MQPPSQDIHLNVPSALIRPQCVEARIHGPDLIAIDVIGSVELELLDLSLCAPGMVVAVRDCPNLRMIYVPEFGVGATFHVDFGERAPRLEIRGAVSDFDACWFNAEHGASRQLNTPSGRERRGPLTNAWLGDVASVPDDAELVMIVDPVCSAGVVSPIGAMELVVSDTSGVSTVRLATPHGNAACRLFACPDVVRLEVTSSMRRVRVARCPRLSQVVGGGATLSITSGACDVPVLDASGAWDRVRLAYSPTRALLCDLAENVRIGLCPNLTRVRALAGTQIVFWGATFPQVEGGASIEIEPLSERMLDDALETGQAELREAVVGWCERPAKPKRALRAIQLLAAALRAGHDPVRVWEARCNLANRARGPRRFQRSVDEAWTWCFPDDLGDRGWNADLAIWRACHEHSAAAAAFGPIIVAHGDPEHLAALASAWRQTAPGAADDVLLGRLLLEALTAGASSGRGIDGQQEGGRGASPLDVTRLQTLIEVLAVQRRRVTRQTLPTVLADWVHRRLPNESGFELLGLLRVLGCARAVHHLTAAVADHSRAPEVRRLALQQVLAPVGEPLLAESQLEGEDHD